MSSQQIKKGLTLTATLALLLLVSGCAALTSDQANKTSEEPAIEESVTEEPTTTEVTEEPTTDTDLIEEENPENNPQNTNYDEEGDLSDEEEIETANKDVEPSRTQVDQSHLDDPEL